MKKTSFPSRNYKRRSNKRYFRRLKIVDLPLELLHRILTFCDNRSVFSLFITVKGLYDSLKDVDILKLKERFCKNITFESKKDNLIEHVKILPNMSFEGKYFQYYIQDESKYILCSAVFSHGKLQECFYYDICKYDDRIVSTLYSIEVFYYGQFQYCKVNETLHAIIKHIPDVYKDRATLLLRYKFNDIKNNQTFAV